MINFLLNLFKKKKTNKPPSRRKWSNRNEYGSNQINKMIDQGWTYSHEFEQLYSFYSIKEDDWSITISGLCLELIYDNKKYIYDFYYEYDADYSELAMSFVDGLRGVEEVYDEERGLIID